MQTVLKADIFFFITAISIVILTIGLSIALYFIIRILMNLKVLSEKAKVEGGKILDDVRIIREGVENKASLFSGFVGSVFRGSVNKPQKKTKNTKRDIDINF